MLDVKTQEQINRYLSDVISAAREDQGLDVEEVSSLTGLTEAEYIALETFPSAISLSTLNQVMSAFHAQYELVDATNTVSAMIYRKEIDKLVFRRPYAPRPTVDRPPAHPPGF